MSRISISKRDLKKTAGDLEKEAKSLEGYVWCRISDIIEDLCRGDRDKKVVILACLNVLDDFSK